MATGHERNRRCATDADGGHVADSATAPACRPTGQDCAASGELAAVHRGHGSWEWTVRPARAASARRTARRRPGRARSASTSTCRSARRAAATATSTPTRPRSWAAPASPTAGSTRCAGSWRRPARARSRRRGPDGDGVRRRRDAVAARRRRARRGARRGPGDFGLAPGAEVTTEANPESTSPEFFAGCARPGSPGSRWACSRRPRTSWACWTACTRRAGRSRRPREARAAGFAHVNLDLIYGTPGETDDDLRPSLDAARRGAASTTSRPTR